MERDIGSLALAPYYKHIYELNSNIGDIQDIKNNPFWWCSISSNYSHIGKILFDVIPVDTMAGQDWNAIGVLNFNKGAVAVVLYAIVAATEITPRWGIRKLPWYEDGFKRSLQRKRYEK